MLSFDRKVILNVEDLLKELSSSSKDWIAIDTETTGLHIKADKPFLITLTFDDKSRAIVVKDFTKEDLSRIFDYISQFKHAVGHNIKFDLHMLENIGVKYFAKNLTDTMILARLALDTDETFSLALKSLAKKYIDEDADSYQKVIKSALVQLKKDVSSGRTTVFDEESSEEPSYYDVFKQTEYREAMINYALNDTEITLQLAKKLIDVVQERKQDGVLALENSIIVPLLRMERVGLKIDIAYLKDRKAFFDKHINEKRKELHTLTGESFNVGQHKSIKDWFNKNGFELASSDDSAMEHVARSQDGRLQVVAKIIQELRSLEKWYSTYIVRMLEKSAFDGRAYTQFNPNSAITGRLSSDFHQFPKYPILNSKGEEIFHPRRMVIPTGEGYNKLAFLDYSQIELRVQANYTYEISGGDLNMCRAYMPFKCQDIRGIEFDPTVHKTVIFKETWYQLENDKVWKPTDLHSATTREAFPDVPENSDEFKKLRGLGKSTNFAKNYGATKNALIEQFGFEESIAEKLDKAYYQAFPKILDYQNLVRKIYYERGYVKNMYGRRYYMTDKRFVYRLYNYLVQGSCADMLKSKIVEIDNLLSKYKSRFQMNIHDELSFEIYDGEEFLIDKIKEIMEDVPSMTVPVVSELETTETNWAEKD
jgi:DNA polymerase-1